MQQKMKKNMFPCVINLQLKIRYCDPLNKHPGYDYLTVHLKKVLLA